MPEPLTLAVDDIRAAAAAFQHSGPTEILRWAWEQFGSAAAIGTSFQGAGLVAIHHAVSAGLPFPVFTIDTGLLFEETRTLRERLEQYFGVVIESLHPSLSVEQQAAEYGAELWRRDPDFCCSLRKVLPLQEKLNTCQAWITGVRRFQGENRTEASVVELYAFDRLQDKYIVKINPLVNWTTKRVWDYIRHHRIPFNPLRDRGYLSIGCEPCTRPGKEDDRAGRWSGFDKTECGIHTFLGKNL